MIYTIIVHVGDRQDRFTFVGSLEEVRQIAQVRLLVADCVEICAPMKDREYLLVVRESYYR